MAVEDMLWALAESIRIGMVDKNATPAFTRIINGMASLPETGYCVAYKETQNQFGREGLNFAVDHARRHFGIVGGWYFNGKFYFDSVRIYHDRSAAVSAARENEQIGIYNLSRGEYIPIMDEGVNAVKGSAGTFSPGARGRAMTV